MEELEQILRAHAARYPKMEPTDAVKLIYQNEFGGGHLIRDPEACLQYLRREYAATVPNPDATLYEPIGNGIVRVYLAALPAAQLEPLGQAFLRSAAAHRGCQDCFVRKLAVLQNLAQADVFSFSPEELRHYLHTYAEAGFPPVSHSETYRACYAPAYRIIQADCIQFLQQPIDLTP